VKNECDYWSLGIIIYKFFAERPPFLGEFDEETIQKIEEDPVEFPPKFPDLAKDLCMRLLEKDATKRLGCGREGTDTDLFALKAHPFFDGIDFDYLHKFKSPIPIPNVHRSSFKTKIIEEYKSIATTPSDLASPMMIDGGENFSSAVTM